MINLKIKTLDSRDHDFSVEDAITVRQFKEHIVTKTGIAADMQRLIYCGRVLNDEKPLSEYNVNGKVVHLVERAPPRTRTAEEQLTDLLNRHRTHHHTHTHHRGPAQFMRSSIEVPVEIPITGANGTTLNPSSTLCMNRIIVARYMLTCVDNIVNYLDNPELGLNNNQMDINYQQTMESTVFEVGISTTVPQHNMQNFVHAFQGAVSNVFGQNVLSNIEVSNPSVVDNDGFARSAQMIVLSGTATNPMATPPAAEPAAVPPTTGTPGAARTRSLSETATASTSTPPSTVGGESASGASSTSSTTSSADSSPSRNQTTSPTVLAEVVQKMRTVQTRLEPYLQQYYDLLLNERQFGTTESTERENMQRVFDRVSEALHYMSHAQHAISDLMLDLTPNVPRHLSCRPILVEQSAYQSMIPLPRGAGIVNGGISVNNNESGAPNNNNANIPHVILDLSNLVMPMTAHPSADNQAQPQPAGAAPNPSTPPTSSVDPPPAPSGIPNAPTVDENVPSVARLIQGIMNQVSLYSNLQVDLHMIDDQDVMNQQQQADAEGNTSPTDAPPSDEQMPEAERTNADPEPTLVGDVAGTPPASSNAPAAPVNAADTATAANGQPRVTTATHPTTSTQTRSTTRPQVHLHRIQPNMGPPALAFDRFLPCSSHHVRDNQAHNVPIPNFVHRRTPVRRAFATTINLNGGRSRSQNAPRQTATAGAPGYNSADLTASITMFNGSMTIRELLNVLPSVSAVNRNRLNWQRYVIDTLGEIPTDSRWNELYERLESVVNQSVVSRQPNLRYHAANSINNLVRHSLPAIVELILNDDSAEFGARLLRNVVEFIFRLMNVLVLCVGRLVAGTFLVDMLMRALSSDNLLSSRHIISFIRNINFAAQQHMVALQANAADVQEFLCISMPPVNSEFAAPQQAEAVPMDTDEVVVNVSSQSNQAVESTPVARAQPPLDATPIATSSTTPLVQLSSIPPPQLATDTEPLPQVLIGSQPWHANLPNSWVPIITRDIGRQNRATAQAPYSDAYLTGMSSKRRKVIASERPSTSDPRTMLGESARAALRQRPNTSGSSTAALAAVEQSTTALQAPFENAMRTLVRSRVQNDNDYDPARYPNLDKWTSNAK